MRISRHSLAIKLLLDAADCRGNCRKMDDNQLQLASIRYETVRWESIFYNNTDRQFRFISVHVWFACVYWTICPEVTSVEIFLVGASRKAGGFIDLRANLRVVGSLTSSRVLFGLLFSLVGNLVIFILLANRNLDFLTNRCVIQEIISGVSYRYDVI